MRTFDPYSDRTARDLRNALSSALVEQLTGESTDAVQREIDRWVERELTQLYTDYIARCRQTYGTLIDEIAADGCTDPRYQAVFLWNAGLFFELHELLETIWMKAKEPERSALKGWIQAAGAFVHNLRGKPKAAQGLALRARKYLRGGADVLGYIANLDRLIEALEHLPDEPVKLELKRGAF